MTPFEDLITELGKVMDLPLKSDFHQSCLLDFGGGVRVQIDLDSTADNLLLGSEVGTLRSVGRQEAFRQALRVNGASNASRGILAYSEMKDSLVLFQFFPLSLLNGEKLYKYLQLFAQHARAWHYALEQGTIPEMEGDARR